MLDYVWCIPPPAAVLSMSITVNQSLTCLVTVHNVIRKAAAICHTISPSFPLQYQYTYVPALWYRYS